MQVPIGSLDVEAHFPATASGQLVQSAEDCISSMAFNLVLELAENDAFFHTVFHSDGEALAQAECVEVGYPSGAYWSDPIIRTDCQDTASISDTTAKLKELSTVSASKSIYK